MRATRYRTFVRPATQPDEPAREKTVHDLQVLIDDLPWTGELLVWVQAANAAGDSPVGPSATVLV